jgi:hypothetical protein
MQLERIDLNEQSFVSLLACGACFTAWLASACRSTVLPAAQTVKTCPQCFEELLFNFGSLPEVILD